MVERISVIVPVYNVILYLEQCIESILVQEYDDLEILLIDDGSTDGSGALCDKLAKQDSRIIVLHQRNSGAAEARNAGLRVATGKYLSFVDSDDYLEPGAYLYMLSLLKEHNADVVQGSFRNVFKSHTTTQDTDSDHACMTGIDYLRRFTTDWTCSLLWDKLFRRELFNGILFETGHRIDDEYFTYRGIMNAKKIIRDNRIVYNYRKRASSVMFAPASAHQIVSDRIDYLSKRRKIVIERFPQLRAVYDSHFLNMMIILSRDVSATEENIQVIRQHLKSYFYEENHTKPDYHLFPALAKLMLFSPENILSGRKPIQPADNQDSFFE